MLAAGSEADLAGPEEMLGHSKINTALDFYSHVLPDMQREATDRLDIMLS
jgi:integrase